VIEVLEMIQEREIERLRDDLVFIDDRLTELAAMLERLNLPATSYHLQELQSERNTLMAHHRVIIGKIQELTHPDAARVSAAERTERLRQATVERYRRACIERAEDFERLGDFRNASLTRLEALNARKVAEHEIH
jgi:hypothetical protein